MNMRKQKEKEKEKEILKLKDKSYYDLLFALKTEGIDINCRVEALKILIEKFIRKPYIVTKVTSVSNDQRKFRKEGYSYLYISNLYNQTFDMENDKLVKMKKDDDIKFHKYIGSNISCLFEIQRKFELQRDIVDRTLNGENTILISSNEILDQSESDIIEFNRIILYKRLAFALNYIAYLSIAMINDSLLNDKMGLYVKRGIMISKQFVDSNGQIKHEKISVYFDGIVHTGSWYVDDLVREYLKIDHILYIPEDSVYPLSLCLKIPNMIIRFEHLLKYEKCIFEQNGVDWKGRRIECNMFDAIPGSGKTHSMMEKVLRCGIINSIIIVPTKEEAKLLRSRKFKAYTIDSLHKKMNNYNINDNFNQFISSIKYVFVDECFMIHSGQLRYVLKKLRSITFYDYVYMYGDKGQIPYYAFVNTVIKHHRDFQYSIDLVSNLDATYRCPIVLKQFLESVYERKIVCKSVIKGELKFEEKEINSIVERIKILNDYTILVFTQAEKMELINRLGQKWNVITVAESQGQTYVNVCLVRINFYDRVIYSQKEHVVVALTRFKNKFLYLTVKEDYLCNLVNSINKGKKIEVRSQNLNLGRYDIEINVKRKEANNVMEELSKVECNFEQSQFAFLCDDRIGIERKDRIDDAVYSVQRRFNQFKALRAQHHMSNSEYVDKVLVLKEYLEQSGIRINQTKFNEILRKEKEEMQQEILNKDLKIGQFFAYNAPEARLKSQNLLNTFSSIRKRNADVSKIRNFMMTVDPLTMVNNFKECFIDKEKWDNLVKLREQFSADFVEEWKHTRNAQQLNKLAYEHANISNIDFTEYHSFIKTIVKNPLTYEEAYTKDQVAQVVAGAHAVMVEYFTPMVKQFSLILKSVLKDEFLINDGVTIEQMEYFVNSRLSGKRRTVVPLEMDYSKFDKNQDWIDLYYQMLIMREFGIPDWICGEWISVHTITSLRFAKYGLIVPTLYQRKSGDAFTFMGNTLFTMIMYATYYKDIPVQCGLFGGDDSLLIYDISDHDKIMDKGQEIAAAFNMEIKYLDTSKSVMFASRFFIFTEDYIYILPDLVKQFIRYNRVAKSQEHVWAQQMSSRILNNSIYNLNRDNWVKFYRCMFSRYEFNDDEYFYWDCLCTQYLTLLYIGRTDLLYHEFDKLPHADEGTMNQLKHQIFKKINYEQFDVYRAKNVGEIKMIKQLKKSTVKVVDDKSGYIKQTDVVIKDKSMIKEIKLLYMSSLLSWFDNNKISRGNIFKNIYVKYSTEELLSESVYKAQRKELTWFQWFKSFFFDNSETILKSICIEKKAVTKFDIDQLQNEIDTVNYIVKKNTGYEFKTQIVLVDTISLD